MEWELTWEVSSGSISVEPKAFQQRRDEGDCEDEMRQRQGFLCISSTYENDSSGFRTDHHVVRSQLEGGTTYISNVGIRRGNRACQVLCWEGC